MYKQMRSDCCKLLNTQTFSCLSYHLISIEIDQSIHLFSHFSIRQTPTLSHQTSWGFGVLGWLLLFALAMVRCFQVVVLEM